MIRYVTPERATQIISGLIPRGLFFTQEGDTYLGLDNSTGDCWIEEFCTLVECLGWLSDPEVEVS